MNPHSSNSPETPRSALPAVTILTRFNEDDSVFDETAQSILDQSLQDWEWLILREAIEPAASRSQNVINQYRNLDARIRVVDLQGNKGGGAVWNHGFQEARAPYVLRVSCGVQLDRTCAEKFFWYLESHPECSFADAQTTVSDSDQQLLVDGFSQGQRFLEQPIVVTSALIRVSAHRAVGGHDETVSDEFVDGDFWLACAERGYWGATIPEALSRRCSASQAGHAASNDTRGFRQRVKAKYPRLFETGIPAIAEPSQLSFEAVPVTLPCSNRLPKSKPRLLIILPWLNMGGADKFNLDLAEQVTKRGWDVTIATTLPSDHPWLAEFMHFTTDIFPLSRFLRLTDYPRFLRYLIESRQPEVVLLTHSEFGQLLLPFLRAFCPQPVYLDYCHIEEESWKSGGHARGAVDYQEQLELAVVTSEHLKQWMVRRGSQPDRVEVCYINVDPDRWRPDPALRAEVRREMGIGDTIPVLLYAGRLCEQKQPKVFANVMKNLRQQGLGFLALVAGDGEDWPWLEQFLRQHHLGERIWLLGAVSSARMQRLMAASDLFFLPSKWEGIALSAYEAMASGLVVVGADVGGQRELITEDSGLLLPKAETAVEIDRYTTAIARLLAEPERRTEIGQHARARICQHFRLNAMGDRMLALFERARSLQATQPRPPVSPGLGLACAVQAVEYTRLDRHGDWMWQQLNLKSSSAKEAGTSVGGNGGRIWTKLGLRVIPRRRSGQTAPVQRHG